MSSVLILIQSSALILLLTAYVLSLDICQQNNGNLNIKEAFRIEKRLYFYTEDNKLIVCDSFEWNRETNSFEAKDCDEKSPPEFPELEQRQMKVAFPIIYGKHGLRVIQIFVETRDAIKQLTGRRAEVKGNGDLIAEAEGIVNLNMYKYKPNEDAINLQSLLIKLPQEGIEDSLQTVANFPLETSRWPPRLFVYYIETPGKGFPNDGRYHSKRYVFVAENRTYGTDVVNEWNWHLDDWAYAKCDDLNGIKVNASLTIDDYGEDGTFHLMEIFGNQYRIYSFQLHPQNNLKTPVMITTNFVGAIFQCKQPRDSNLTPEPPSGGRTWPTRATPVPTEPPKKFQWFWIILLLLLVVIVVAVVAYLWMKKAPENEATPASGQQTHPELGAPPERSAEASTRSADLELTPLQPPPQKSPQLASQAAVPKISGQAEAQSSVTGSQTPLPKQTDSGLTSDGNPEPAIEPNVKDDEISAL